MLLRHWESAGNIRLVVVPGRRECVAALAREPMVPELVRDVLAHDGQLAVAHSAESLLEKYQQTLPADMSILPKGITEEHYLPQGQERDDDFIKLLIKQIR